MPSHYCDLENEDGSVFPAYAAYLYGVDMWPEAEDKVLLDFLQYTSIPETIYYTNSMPSRSMLYACAPDAFQRHDPIEAWKSKSGYGDGPPVLDLRLPSLYPDMVMLVPPELVQAAPPPRRLQGLTTPKASGPMSSAEITRRKLLNASQQWSKIVAPPVSSSPHHVRRTHRSLAEKQGSPEQRRLPARQSIHPSLLRSSSATDVDSQIGSLSTSRPTTHSPLDSPTPLHTQAVIPRAPSQKQILDPLSSPVSQEATPLGSQITTAHVTSVPLIHPGDLVSNPRYAAMPAPTRQQIDAQLTQWWRVAQQYSDIEARKQAFARIQIASTHVHRVLEHTVPAQAPTVYSTPSQQICAQSAVLPSGPDSEGQAEQLQQQHCPQRLEQRTHSQQYLEYSQQYQQPDTPCLEPLVHSQGRSKSPPSISAAVRARVDAELPKFFAAYRFTSMSPADAKEQAEHVKARAYQKEFFSSLPVEAQPYLKHSLEKLWARHESSQPFHLPPRNSPIPIDQPLPRAHQYQAASQIQVVDIAPELRAYINANLPRFFEAIRCAASPDAHPVARQNADEFRTQFKASLPEEGHAYIEEIAARMAVAQCEGRDMMSAIGG
jgi:hypothetical protein